MSAQKPKLKFERKPITIAVKRIKAIEETDEVGRDEPYVLVTAANLANTPPNVEATLYGPWGDVETGDVRSTTPIPPNLPASQIDAMQQFLVWRKPFWGLDNKTPALIAKPDDVMFIVSVMEHDDGHPKATRELAKTAMLGSLVASVGMDRATRVEKAIRDVRGALAVPTGAPNFDDHVGTKELRLTLTELLLPLIGPHETSLVVHGDGGDYQVVFEFV
jgi:hypothetical protein